MKEIFAFLSHPNIPLVTHLKKVAEISGRIYNETYIKNANRKLLFNISQLIALGHDFGKFSSFFQEYILNINDKQALENLRKKRYNIIKNFAEIPDNNDLKDHSKISALFTYFLVKKLIEIKYSDSKNNFEVKFLPLISFLIVKKHHGNVLSFESDLRKDMFLKKGGYEKFFKLILEKIDFTIVAQFYAEETKKISLDLDHSKLIDFNEDFMLHYDSLIQDYSEYNEAILEKFGVEFEDISDKCVLNKDISIVDMYYFLFFELLYSILLDSDKKEASKSQYITTQLIDKEIVNTFVNEKFNIIGSTMNELRSDFYKIVDKNVESIDLSKNIYSITVPTGFGKTLASFNFAIKLMNRIESTQHLKYIPRIIYSLPFTTIIEQNHRVFFDVLKVKYDMQEGKSNNILLSHHHLSDIRYSSSQSEDDIRVEDALFYIENWDSQIIVTTFIQLFMSFINNKNKTLKRFHKIANSIIILDEIQAIPPKHYSLIRNIFFAMANYFNTYFLFVTATKPLLVESEECVELVEKNQNYFSNMDRIDLYLEHTHPETIDSFFLRLKQFIQERCKDKSAMIICNTIKSSKNIFSLLKNEEFIQNNFKLIYLSTNIIPKERLKKIDDIKSNPKNKIIVTTQLVEAGVDIDINFVFRDFSPISSINQSCGRCNRNFLSKGEVHLINLIDEKNKIEYNSYIYDNILIDISKNILKEYDSIIPESKFLTISNKYFERVHEKISSNHIISKLNLQNILLMNLKGISENFKLIEEDFEKVSIFIELDDYAKVTWKKYLENLEENDLLKRKKDFLYFKADFFKYVITVSKRDFPEFENLKVGFISYIPFNNLASYYDLEHGFTNSNIW